MFDPGGRTGIGARRSRIFCRAQMRWRAAPLNKLGDGFRAHIFQLVETIIFNFCCPKRTFRSDFVRFSSELLYLLLAKNGRLFVVVVVVAIHPILTYLKKNKALVTLKNMLTRKKLVDVLM